MPVSRWLVDAIRPQPGHRVLELAAGPGDTGLLAAELIEPGGTLICSDLADPMLEVARSRAGELGIANVEFRVIDAEWIDLETASVDGVICRFGYMLLADPAAALRETRRVLRPGGRVALAVWDEPAANPWLSLRQQELVRLGLSKPAPSDQPGPLALGNPERLSDLLADAGFADIEVEALTLEMRFDSLQHYWDVGRDLGAEFARAIDAAGPEVRDELRRALARAFASYTAADGALSLPARALVAAADA
jgi:SAM-dependent methyltransferase